MKTITYKNLIVHNLEKFPKNYEYTRGDIDSLSDYALDKIVALGIDECWYWYASGSYEGSGQILMRRGKLYDFGDMGHCSCYGPTEGIKFNGKKITDIKMSKEYKSEVKNLIEAANLRLEK